MGIIYTVIPYSPHLHPPCSVLYGFTEHEGWELINFTLMYHVPELATDVVHPPRALAERYRFGIPITLLASQLATGICTKEKVGNFELG